MDIAAKIKTLAERFGSIRNNINTEESTKHSLVMPFLQALGYDVFDPTVVVPEFTADIGIKKGEKVDYAIIKDGKPLILIEVKMLSEKLDNHTNQLVRYFGVTESKFGFLTNGNEYRIFSDLEDTNRMDATPFLTFSIENLKEREIMWIEKFAQHQLDTDKILAMASSRKNAVAIKDVFRREISTPSDEFARFFASKITQKRLTQPVLEDFKSCIKSSFKEIIGDLATEQINTIKSGLNAKVEEEMKEEERQADQRHSEIVTTEEELEGYFIVKSILAEKASLHDITCKDTKSYFGILYQGNTWKWICRLYFNTSQKYISYPEDKTEKKIPLEKVEDIYLYKNELISIVDKYLIE